MIQIKYGNNVLFEVLETPSCERVVELMSSDHVRLSWVSREGDAIPAGAFIVYQDETFTLLDEYKPTQRSENEFEYAPEFGSSIMAWGKVPFFLYTTDSQGHIVSREMDWSLTGGAGVFLDRICDSIEKETGVTYTYSFDDNLPGSKNQQFSLVDILSALNGIANAFETEWWVDKANNVIHLSKCEVGTAETLTVGGNVKTPSVQLNSEGFYNRYYAFGSTRNIVQSYTGANVNNLVNKRLTLNPEDYPNGYYEPSPIPLGGKVFSKILVFDDIYPAATNFVAYDILSRQEYVLDESTGKKIQIGTDDDGNPIYDMYAVYYIKIGTKSGSTYTQYTINAWEYSEKDDRQEGPQPGREGQLIPGLNVSVHFDSGSLRGREFEVRYVTTQETYSGGTPLIVTPGYFEIKYVKDGNYIIPDIVSLRPQADDKVILFNLRMPDEYIEDAYGRLEQKMLDTIAEKFDADLNLYTVASNPIAFEDDNPNLGIGSRVKLVNGDYSLTTRVTKLSSRIDFPYVQTITVGNSLVKGTIQELKEEVTNANTNLGIISTLNNTAKAIADAYTRTQQIIIENFSKFAEMFELDETSVPGKILIKAKHDGLYSLGDIVAGGVGTGEIPTPTTTLGGLLNVTDDADDIQSADKILVRRANASGGDSWTLANLSDISGTVVGVRMNGVVKNPGTDKIVDLGTVLTEHQSLAAYRTSANQDTIDDLIRGRLTTIEGLIPSAATTSNQLADKSFVNSSIATATATFRGTSASGLTEAQFLAWANGLTKDNNDYVFWNTTDTAGNVQFKRYKYNGTSWAYEYTLNNSSFTAAQWSAVNSGITSTLVTAFGNKYDKPSSGIPLTDLSSGVQISLGKADSALQSASIKTLTLQKNGTTIDSYNPLTAKTINITDVASAQTLSDLKTWIESMFEKVTTSVSGTTTTLIKAKFSLYSEGEITAGGVGSCGGGGAAVWGGITGTLSNQTDLWNALQGKQNSLGTGTNGQILSWQNGAPAWVAAPATGVTSLGGKSGAIGIGSGLSVTSANTLTNTGVLSVGSQTGAITLRGGQTANGSVNLAMSGTQLQASIVGLGNLAYQPDVVTALGYTPYNAANIGSASVNYANYAGYLPSTGISSESQIVTNGLRIYQGSGASWTGDMVSMRYAQILAIGAYSRGFQIWAMRGSDSLHWRNGKDDQTGWNTERTIYDSSNLTAATLGLGNVENKSSATIRGELTAANVTTALGNTAVAKATDADTLDGQHASYFATASSLGNYLPLTGGTLTGTLIMQNDSNTPYIMFKRGTANAAYLYYLGGTRWNVTNEGRGAAYSLYHSGNCNNTSTAWSASSLTLNGAISGATSLSVSSFEIRRASDNTRGFFIENESGTNGFKIGAKGGSGYISFMTNSDGAVSEKMRIIYNGNVGIGTTSPSEKLYVAGNIVATGEVTAGTSSDSRFKDNQTALRNADAVLKSLRPMEFDWNDLYHSVGGRNEGHDVGFLAQDVQPLIPSAIGKVYGDYLRLDYNKVTPYLVAGWQSHETRIERLERENRELRQQIQRLQYNS